MPAVFQEIAGRQGLPIPRFSHSMSFGSFGQYGRALSFNRLSRMPPTMLRLMPPLLLLITCWVKDSVYVRTRIIRGMILFK